MNTPDFYVEKRPWGQFTEFVKNSPCTVKILLVKSGEAFSLQRHQNREEFWRVIKGKGKITVGNDTYDVVPGDQFYISKNTNHRITGIEDIEVLEIAFGTFNEDDIIRLEDKYNRP